MDMYLVIGFYGSVFGEWFHGSLTPSIFVGQAADENIDHIIFVGRRSRQKSLTVFSSAIGRRISYLFSSATEAVENNDL
jgi:hypothetical protein